MPYCLLTRSWSHWFVALRSELALLLVVGVALPTGAANRRRLPGTHVPAAVARLAPVGQLPGSQRLKLAIGLPLRNGAKLDALLQQLYDPASPGYRRYVAPEQFTARYGPTEADYQALIDFARANGLTVTTIHPNRLVLSVSGRVADVEKTFGVTLRVYPHPTEARTFYAPDVEPTVDFPLPILDISGLDDYSLPHPNVKPRPANLPASPTPNAGSGPSGSYRGYDFRTAYVPGTSLTGAGQSVGLLQFDGFYASDITTYESQAGLPNVPLTVVPVDGGVSTPGSGVTEVSLDIEMVISMAPGVSRVYVFEAPNPSPWVDLLNAMVAYTNIHQFSCSWGGGSVNASAENIFKQMAAQGQSFFNATGDSDAFTGSISFPSDSTNITEVGGTTLTTGSGATYSSETVWNWGLVQGNYVGSSGGVSTYYAIPFYQLGISMVGNQGSTTMRNVPDVALTADNVYVVYGNGSAGSVGGTSCAAPLWAGFTALVNQQAAEQGEPRVGFLNPALYTIGKGTNYALAFHDTTTGNNFSRSSPTKYSAVPGYDLCTGWGTPNGTNLINALAPPPAYVPLLVSNSFILLVENCTNGVVDPAETVTVSLGLKNIGRANTSNLVATLLATNGLLSPSGPHTYGVLVTNGVAVALPFTFTASGSCGGTNTATLQLQDGAANLGTVAFSFTLGQRTSSTVFSENFDSVTAPALPAGWSSSASGGQSPWVSSTSASDSAPNSVFSSESTRAGVNELDSPVITLPTDQTQLAFRHSYALEAGYDGGVLEIKIGSGTWTDILAAGGSFVSGPYDGVLGTGSSNPLGGRSAWTGSSSGFISTVVNLPAAASGQAIQLRWRCATDKFTSVSGWYVDTVTITRISYVCCTADTNSPPTITSQPGSLVVPLSADATFEVTAIGSAPLSYQWRFNGTNLAGAVNSTLTVTNAQQTEAGSYSVLVTNDYGSILSSNAVLTLLDPWIIEQPQSITAAPGAVASFTVNAVGTAPLGYQWFRDGVTLADGTNIYGSQAATVNVVQVQLGDLGNYSVVVSNAYGQAVSSNATLVAYFPPVISIHPISQTVPAGSLVSFTSGATGSSPISYRWQRGGTNLVDGGKISGSTTTSLSVSNVQAAEVGSYSLVATNAYGTAVSAHAVLTLLAPPLIMSFSLQTNGSFVLNGSGGAGLSYVLFGASNLNPPLVWSPIQTNQPDSQGFFQFTDPEAANQPQRYYRVAQ